MAAGFFNTGKPNGTQDSEALDGTVVTLTARGNHSAILQVRESGGGYSNSREICVYRVDNGTPGVGTGFYLGDGDYRIFSPGELKNGVKFITGESGKSGKYTLQYYVAN